MLITVFLERKERRENNHPWQVRLTLMIRLVLRRNTEERREHQHPKRGGLMLKTL